MGETFRIEIPVNVKDNTEPGISTASKKIRSFENTMKKTEERLDKMKSSKVEMALTAVDKASSIINKVKNSAKSIMGKAWKTTISVVDKATAPIKGILNMLANPILQAGAVLGISIGLAGSINTFKDFEAAMSQVQAISGATADEMELLNEKAKEMGANTKFTATEAGEAFNYMAMAGWKAEDMLSGIEGILNLAAASGTDLATTSDIVTDALTAFGLAASDAGHFSDVLAAASSSANTNVTMMGETFKYAGTMAGSLGYTIEDVALMTGLMANSGIKASMAGTALNSIFTRLATDAGASSKSLGALGVLTEELGVGFYDTEGNARALVNVMDDLRYATKGLNDEEKSYYANKIAGMEAQKGLLAILNASEADYNKLKTAINGADGAAAQMADTMLDNQQGSLTLLQSAVDGAKLRLGERLSPYLREFADWLTSAMPQVNEVIDSIMDFVDEKIEGLRSRIGEMTSGVDWKRADFFGKVEIAWDTLIVTPFSEWWSKSGKAAMAEKAADIGKGIGAAVSTGLMALLGIDITGAAGDGVSIGAAFGKGLVDGFDIQGLKEKMGEALKSLFSNAADILPGGDPATLSSWMSAALIAKAGGSILGAGMKGINLGRTIAGAGNGSLLGKAVGSFSLSGELAGTGLAGGSGLLGLLGKTGMLMKSGAVTGVGQVLAGGGAIAGGVIGGAALVSGIKDLSIALKEDKDAQKSNAYAESAAWKIGGVGAGAVAGAAIGSVIPVIGTGVGALVGAGVGGIAGWVKGKKEVEEYQEAVEKAALEEQEQALKAALAREQAKYASQELKDALAEGVSDSQFAYMLQKIESDSLASHFGSISLSMEEIKELAQRITIPKEAVEGLELFASSSQIAENNLDSLKDSVLAMEKLNWKAGLGLEMDEAGIEAYKSGIDDLITNAKEYLEAKNFEADMALKILVNEEDPSGIIAGVDAVYEKIQNELYDTGEELTAEVNIALEDGVIDVDEQKIISELQQKIQEITDKLSNAEMDAKMQVLKVKYGGAQLDYDSFSQLQRELAEQTQTYADQYEQALTVGITSLNLEFGEGLMSHADYDAAVKELKENYQANIDSMRVNVENFELEAIAEAYGSALDGILPEMQGTTAEKLSAGLHDAIASGVDAADWNGDTVRQFLGLESLQTEAADEIAQLMGLMASAIPEQTVEAIREAADPGAVETAVRDMAEEGISAGAENMDVSAAGQTIVDKTAEAVSSAGTEKISTATQTMLNDFFGNMDMSEGAMKLTDNFAESIAAAENPNLSQAIGDQINASSEDIDLAPTAESVMTKLTDSLSEADYTEIGGILLDGMLEYFEEADFTELGEALTYNIAESLTSEETLVMLETAVQTMAVATDTYLNNEFSLNVGNDAGNNVPGNISQSLERSKENVHPGCDAVVNEVDSYLTNQLNALSINASPTVTITPNYVVNGAMPDLTGGLGRAGRHASGGVVSGPQLSWVGEEGPEVIIPTVPSRRARALELYEKAGEMLGVEKHADGGITGSSGEPVPVHTQEGNRGQNSSGNNQIVVEVSANPVINISAGSETDAEGIKKLVDQAIRNMMGDISDEMARKLARQFANMGMA